MQRRKTEGRDRVPKGERENESTKQKLLLNENSRTSPTRQMTKLKLTGPPRKKGNPIHHKGVTNIQ